MRWLHPFTWLLDLTDFLLLFPKTKMRSLLNRYCVSYHSWYLLTDVDGMIAHNLCRISCRRAAEYLLYSSLAQLFCVMAVSFLWNWIFHYPHLNVQVLNEVSAVRLPVDLSWDIEVIGLSSGGWYVPSGGSLSLSQSVSIPLPNIVWNSSKFHARSVCVFHCPQEPARPFNWQPRVLNWMLSQPSMELPAGGVIVRRT